MSVQHGVNRLYRACARSAGLSRTSRPAARNNDDGKWMLWLYGIHRMPL
jgi:hypothetical protein